jgi:hypothetical protein
LELLDPEQRLHVDEHALEGLQVTGRQFPTPRVSRVSRSTRGVLVLTAALLAVSLAAGSPAIATSSRDAIADAALAYARSFDQLLAAEPAEAARLGVDRTTLASLKVTAVHKVRAVDKDFLAANDTRSVDEALVDTDLWWVVLSAGSDARLVVSVRWEAGAAQPEAVGLNWVSARELTASIAAGNDAAPIVVWIPEDVPLVISGPAGNRKATPIAAADLVVDLGVARAPTAIADYSRDLHGRLGAYRGEPATGAEGLAGGGSGGVVGRAPSSAAPATPLPIAPLAALAFIAIVGAVVLRGPTSGSSHSQR